MKPLYPIMAVLAIASVGASAPRALAADGKTPTSTAANTEAKVAPNEIAKQFTANPSSRGDAAARIASFLLDADSEGKSFVAADVNRTGLEAIAKAWAKKEDAGKVAMLYFVAGPGKEAPAWATRDPFLSKVFVPGQKWEARLRVALADWTGKAQIVKNAEAPAVEAFLNDAAAKAATVFADPRTKQEVDESVKAHDTTAVVVPTPTGGNRNGLANAGQGFNFDDLYVNGAVVATVYSPKDEGSRRLSVKIYTSRDPATGELINKVGVYDITDPNNVYGQRFDMNPGESTIALDDRTPGHKKYTMKIETGPNGERSITFGRPGDPPGPGVISTSVEALMMRRADQASSLNNVVSVGGKDFYVVPQGGSKGALAFLPKDAVDNRSMDNIRNTRPGLYAEVSRRNADGDTVNIDGKPHLGKIEDKEFHLEFNSKSGLWEVKDGPGDKPKPPVVAGGDTDTNKTPTTTPGDNTTTPGDNASLDDIEAALLKDGIWQKNPEDNKDIDPEIQKKVRVLWHKAGDSVEYNILVPKEIAAGNQLQYKSQLVDANGAARKPQLHLVRVFGWKHYLILHFKEQQQYLDMNIPDKDSGFALAGSVSKEIGVRGFTDAEALADALRRFTALSAADKGAPDAIPGRVKAFAAGKPYEIEAGFTDKGLVATLVVNKVKTYAVWPKNEPTGSDAPAVPAGQYTGLTGPTNLFTGATTGPDADITEKLDDNYDKVILEKDAALYSSKKTPKTYSLLFRFKDKGGLLRAGPFQVFSEDASNTQTYRPLPKGVQIAGLADGPALDHLEMGYAFVSGTSAEKGVLAVYKNKQITGDNVSKKGANCAGPVLWWGLANKAAAEAVCKADKFD